MLRWHASTSRPWVRGAGTAAVLPALRFCKLPSARRTWPRPCSRLRRAQPPHAARAVYAGGAARAAHPAAPPGADSSRSSLAAVGSWSMSVQLLALPGLAPLTTTQLGADVIPRSICLASLEGCAYVLCGLGDGQLHNWRLAPDTGRLTGVRARRGRPRGRCFGPRLAAGGVAAGQSAGLAGMGTHGRTSRWRPHANSQHAAARWHARAQTLTQRAPASS